METSSSDDAALVASVLFVDKPIALKAKSAKLVKAPLAPGTVERSAMLRLMR